MAPSGRGFFAEVRSPKPIASPSCKGNKPCTSYSRTNGYGKLRTNGYDIAYTFTHNNITLEHNAMNNKNTIAHMDVHNTQY